MDMVSVLNYEFLVFLTHRNLLAMQREYVTFLSFPLTHYIIRKLYKKLTLELCFL